ncbi:MAG: ATP-binding protein, partial [Planctomycetaceae bacterium]|nr:ATP-binding protein [Planctomycetaceae bacterium]
MTVPNYEKLGVFYLGRECDLETDELKRDLVLYDSKDLTTHAVCVGMTGSGKTGLCLSLLEEAAIDNIPVIAIDPKGDLGNLLLTFPDLAPSDFAPWVDQGEAQRKGQTVEEFAAATASKWREGLGEWDQTAERIKMFRDAVDLAIYTPGSDAGLPVSVVQSFAAPNPQVMQDGDAFRDRVMSAVSSLLALLRIDADPISSREHILLSNILTVAWKQGRNLTIPEILREIQKPPFDKVGFLDLDTFFPEKDRFQFSILVNNLLASPGFASWMHGEALNIERLLMTREGKPRISIMSIAHLSDSERMFFVTILLNELLSWVRSQPGTTSLRAILYMDEVFGYFPPTANPPSKLPMLTLLKQARAFGVGVVLATQNPVDLDYKGLSNTGTWFLGR